MFSGDPRIAVVGGAEVQQSILARLLAANGWRVSMVCLDYGQPQALELDGVTVHKSFRPQAGIPIVRFLHPRLTSMWRALHAADADVYYQRSTAVWTGVVAQFCRRHGRRSIYAGASDMDFLPGQVQIRLRRDRWLFRRGLRNVDRIVVQNAVQRETCRAYYGREALVIPSCYQPPPGARRGGGDRVLWVGTVHENKRPEMLLELARRLPHRRFVMVGGPMGGRSNPYFEDVRRQAAAVPNVEFTGFMPLAQVESRFDEARVVVNTSGYEGMPNVFLQAWARGVPTLATVDVGTPVNAVFSEIGEGERRLEAFFADQDLWAGASQRCLRFFEANHSGAEALRRYARLLEDLAR